MACHIISCLNSNFWPILRWNKDLNSSSSGQLSLFLRPHDLRRNCIRNTKFMAATGLKDLWEWPVQPEKQPVHSPSVDSWADTSPGPARWCIQSVAPSPPPPQCWKWQQQLCILQSNTTITENGNNSCASYKVTPPSLTTVLSVHLTK